MTNTALLILCSAQWGVLLFPKPFCFEERMAINRNQKATATVFSSTGEYAFNYGTACCGITWLHASLQLLCQLHLPSPAFALTTKKVLGEFPTFCWRFACQRQLCRSLKRHSAPFLCFSPNASRLAHSETVSFGVRGPAAHQLRLEFFFLHRKPEIELLSGSSRERQWSSIGFD